MAFYQRKIAEAMNDVQSNKKTELCNIMTSNKSDKGNGWHNYTIVYQKLFEHMRHNPITVFEMGLGTNNPNIKSNMGADGRFGASLYGWEEYFTSPSCKIYGADIDGELSVNTSRIKTFYADQTSPESLRELWSQPELKNVSFDIMIDDGLHEFEANATMFHNSFHKVKRGGIYIIEDIQQHELAKFKNLSEQIKASADSVIVELPNAQSKYDNTLMLIFKP